MHWSDTNQLSCEPKLFFSRACKVQLESRLGILEIALIGVEDDRKFDIVASLHCNDDVIDGGLKVLKRCRGSGGGENKVMRTNVNKCQQPNNGNRKAKVAFVPSAQRLSRAEPVALKRMRKDSENGTL